MNVHDLVFDWNPEVVASRSTPVELEDETLRDGLQSTTAISPAVDDKIRLLHLMAELGIAGANLGTPSANSRAAADAMRLAEEIVAAGLPLQPCCAARTLRSDIEPIVDISQRAGIQVEVGMFVASSTIRQYVEGWDLKHVLRLTEETIDFAVGEGLRVMYVTEDTTRARPDVLEALYSGAVKCGASRICLTDTVGHATPEGVRRLVRFVQQQVVKPTKSSVKIDWHGHRDRGLALANSLAAAESGVDRVHGTALGVGERCGNTEMDLLLVNLALLGLHDHDLARLLDYVHLVSTCLDVPIPYNYPIFGEDAFRTATGVHASAIMKAAKKGDAWLADRVYSSVPAGMVGRRQTVEVSPMSGVSNVRYWFAIRGLPTPTRETCERILAFAEACNRTLSDEEVLNCGGAPDAETSA